MKKNYLMQILCEVYIKLCGSTTSVYIWWHILIVVNICFVQTEKFWNAFSEEKVRRRQFQIFSRSRGYGTYIPICSCTCFIMKLQWSFLFSYMQKFMSRNFIRGLDHRKRRSGISVNKLVWHVWRFNTFLNAFACIIMDN